MSGVSGTAGLAGGIELLVITPVNRNRPRGLRIGVGVQLDAANFAAKGERVLGANPGSRVGEAQRLIAHERGDRIVEAGKAGELNSGQAVVERDRWRCR